ncbi:MAG: hypothetical protein HQL79_08550 [Magnetococcales bacterium]|nr:hypothetical protein [Magnetococcales bacterium]
MIALNLQPKPPVCSISMPPVNFTFDVETQTFGGKDGEMVAKVASEFQSYGEVTTIVGYAHPLSDRLSLVDLTAVLLPYWDLRDTDLPSLPPIPVDPDMPEDAVF